MGSIGDSKRLKLDSLTEKIEDSDAEIIKQKLYNIKYRGSGLNPHQTIL
jgi:hypothetical protein